MNLPETRLKVELISSEKPYRCCTRHVLHVTSRYLDIPDDQVLNMVRACGFRGQEMRVKETHRVDDCYVKVVRVFCDSGD